MLKIKFGFLVCIILLISCTEKIFLPEGGAIENFGLKIVSPQNKSYPKINPPDLKFSFFSDKSDSVGIDSVHWYSNLQGRIDKGDKSIALKRGIHTITCRVYKNSKKIEKSLLIESSDLLKLNSKNLGKGWMELDFTNISDPETKVLCNKVKFDNNGQAYFSTYNQGIIYQDEKDWRYFSEVEGFTNHVVAFLVENGKIIAGNHQLPYLYFFENGEWIKSGFIPLSVSKPESKVFDGVHSIVKDSQDRYWLGLHSGKILIYDKGKYLSFRLPELDTTIDQLIYKKDKIYGMGEFSNIFIIEGNTCKQLVLHGVTSALRRITVTEDGTILIASYGGFFKYKDGKTTRITKEENAFFSKKVYNVFVDSKKRIWTASEYGISVKEGNRWINYSKEFLGNSGETDCNHIEEDKLGNIWIILKTKILKYSGN